MSPINDGIVRGSMLRRRESFAGTSERSDRRWPGCRPGHGRLRRPGVLRDAHPLPLERVLRRRWIS